MSHCFQNQAEPLWVYLKQGRKEKFGRLVRQPREARADGGQVGTTLSNFFLAVSELRLAVSHLLRKDVFVLLGYISPVAFDIPSLQA